MKNSFSSDSPERLRFHCFDTALGACGIAWGEHGVIGSQLPEESTGATRDRMRVRFAQALEVAAQDVPPSVQAAIQAIQRLLAGETADTQELLAVQLDERALPPFDVQVLALTRQIPVGQTLSYGEVATRLGKPGAARAVGRAEGHNPFAPIVPCHRVLAAAGGFNGGQGGFSAHGGVATKRLLLMIEARASGQAVAEQQSLFDPQA
ncbi:methylated-DNA--[protein]-cysteine S-methyltransferase [Roseateles koreensis]|uniref:Methylated-DNA--[protein]-cysteine S-methyltransferase n=1 Tax=Roseateles koreensis TaxID=2987526 RepID=A0ABT5KQW1_9BURK|nr:methylated-DNA--[protein]-cysteine S-methyltransferase [Roseateles koreensis]MDC8785221.1 methylated-DNA--[protein]-cysteine S-methyltransferase [Roseateles koreensis]